MNDQCGKIKEPEDDKHVKLQRAVSTISGITDRLRNLSDRIAESEDSPPGLKNSGPVMSLSVTLNSIPDAIRSEVDAANALINKITELLF